MLQRAKRAAAEELLLVRRNFFAEKGQEAHVVSRMLLTAPT